MATQTLEQPAFEGIYEVPEVANYLRVTMPHIQGNPQKIYSGKLIRWIRNGLAHPSLVDVPGRELLIVFEDLISMRVIAFMRYFGYSFNEIRKAEGYLLHMTGHERPFATERLWLEKLGATHIYAEIEDLLAVANRHGQLAFPEIARENLIAVHNMTFNQHGVASSWSPDSGIIIDPHVQFGRPCIEGTRIPTGDIVGMFEAGDSVDFLAYSFGLTKDLIESAILWEGKLATKKVSSR